MDPARPSHALAIILGIGIGWLIRATLQSKTNRWGVACFLLLCGLASLAMVAAEWEPLLTEERIGSTWTNSFMPGRTGA